MKTNYFFKHALSLVALFCIGNAFGQAAKVPAFTEVQNPIVTSTGVKNFPFMWEVGTAWGDYNNDGLLDFITSGIAVTIIDGVQSTPRTTTLYKNTGNGTFAEVDNIFPDMNLACVTWLDFDNDGNLDLFISGDDAVGPFSAMYRNLGAAGNYEFESIFDGQFANVDNGGGNRGNRYVAAGDYNNDGWVDLLIEGNNSEGRRCRLYKNLLGTGFEEVTAPVNGVEDFIHMNAGSISWGDYNNDGFLDILCNGYFAEDPRSPLRVPENVDNPRKACGTIIYTNKGDGTFSGPIHFDGGESGDSGWCDYNNDGLLDFVVTGYSYEAGIGWQGDLFKNENGTFTKMLPDVTGLQATQDCSIAWGDVNNDGFSDMLELRAHPNSILLNNFGDDTFTKNDLGLTDLGIDQRGGTVNLVDYDRDGDLDAFMVGYADNADALNPKNGKLMRNDLGGGIPINAAPSVPTNLHASTDPNGVVTFGWDASTDDVTPTEAINYNLYVQEDGSDVTMFVLPADKTTGRLKVNETLAPITKTQYKMKNLGNGNFTFGVQAIDNGKLTSLFATKQFVAGTSSSVSSVNSNNINVTTKRNIIQVAANEGSVGTVNVYDLRGLTIRKVSGQINGSKIELSTGIYLVKVTSGTSTFVKKVVLN